MDRLLYFFNIIIIFFLPEKSLKTVKKILLLGFFSFFCRSKKLSQEGTSYLGHAVFFIMFGYR